MASRIVEGMGLASTIYAQYLYDAQLVSKRQLVRGL